MKIHQPNTPRKHNAKGEKVDEPTQCEACLQYWPCEVELLNRLVKNAVKVGVA